MKITKLIAENFKRIVAVQIEPSGNLVTISGKNGAGKSSTIDAIEAALGGLSRTPRAPIRNGEKSARVVVETEEYVVTRKFTASGSQLEVKGKDGRLFSSPQQLLDRVVGSMSFDPLTFARMDPAKQLDTLKTLVGLDLSALDAERKAAFDERTDIGRQAKAAKAAADKAPHHDGVSGDEVSVADLAAELEQLTAANNANASERQKLEQMRERATALQGVIDDLKAKLAKHEAELETLTTSGKEQAAKVLRLVEADTSETRRRMATAEDSNRKVRDNAAHAKLAAEAKAMAERQQKLTEKIDAIDAKKAETIRAAEFPVEGLGIDDEGVTFNGLPFEQACSAEQLRVSVAIGLGLNRDLKVLLIRDGSLLDAEGLAMVAKMADEAGAQIWLEKVADGAECGVVIEDGQVKGREEKAA